MMDLELLARATANEIILGKIGIYCLRFFITAFILYLIGQSISHLPYLQQYMSRPWGQLIILLLILILSFVLTFYIPRLRFLHNIGLIYNPKDKVWLDITISAIALSRSTWLWHMLIRWLDRRSST